MIWATDRKDLTPTTPTTPTWKWNWLVAIILSLVTMAVFHRVLGADFVAWDDDSSVYQNPNIRGLDAHRLYWMFTDVEYTMRYKPLTWLSYALIHSVDGLNPVGYHLANLLFHTLNAILVFALLQQLLIIGIPQATSARQTKVLALSAGMGALLWAVHPLRVEPVARITDLTYPQSLFFTLISLYCYLRAVVLPDVSTDRRAWYWGSVGAFAAAMLTYPFVCGYTMVLVVLDFYPLRRFTFGHGWLYDKTAQRLWLEKLPFALLSSLIFMTLIGVLHPTDIWVHAPADKALSGFGRAMQASYIWTYFLWRPWIPLNLSPVYTTLVQFDPMSSPFVLSAVAIAGLTALLVWKRRQWPMAMALWICHLALLVPALGLTEHPHYPNDRYSYAAGVLWSVLLAASLLKTADRPRIYSGIAGLTLSALVILSAASFHQTRIWRNSETLFQYMIKKLGNDPYSADIYRRLGKFYADHQRVNEAAYQYAMMYEKYGISLDAQGKIEEAVNCYRKALQLKPNLTLALNNLAWLLATAADPNLRHGSEAVLLAEQACRQTGYQVVLTLVTLSAAYAETGRFTEAIETEAKARSLALAKGNTVLAEKCRNLLKCYQLAQPYRMGQSSKQKGP